MKSSRRRTVHRVSDRLLFSLGLGSGLIRKRHGDGNDKKTNEEKKRNTMTFPKVFWVATPASRIGNPTDYPRGRCARKKIK